MPAKKAAPPPKCNAPNGTYRCIRPRGHTGVHSAPYRYRGKTKHLRWTGRK